MFDFIDASGATDLGVRLAEADSRRDPNRELRVPVSLLAGTVADAARLLVERGTSAEPWARPTSSVDGNEVDASDATPAGGNAGDDAPGGAADTGQGADVAAADVDAAGDADAAEVGDDEVDGRAGVDPADLMEAVEAIGMARRFLAAAESAMIARLEDLESSTKRRGERTAGWLSRSQGVPGRAAAETTRVAAKLDSTFGKFAAALARGEIDHSYCAALVRASNERIEEALVDLQDELLERVAGRRFGSWRRELGAVCALLDTDGPEPLVERDDQLFLSETLDGLVDLKGAFTGSTAEELRQLVEAHTDRLYRQARRDANLTPDLPVPTRTVLRARALLELLRRGSSGEGGAPETHLNLDVEAAPVPGGTEFAEPRLHGDQAPRCDRPTHRDSERHGVEPDGHGDCGGDKHGHGTHGEADNGVCGGDKHGHGTHGEADNGVCGGGTHGDGTHGEADNGVCGGDKHGGDGQGDGVHGGDVHGDDKNVDVHGAGPNHHGDHDSPGEAEGRANRPSAAESSRRWFRRILGQRGDVLAGAARLADGNLWRLLCNPVIHTFVTDGAHEILQMGRAVRVATPAQRRALRLRDGGCVFPGCDVPIGWTQVHHGIHWSDGGRSDLGNLCLLCTHHHEVSHRRGWDMVPDLDGKGRPCGMFRWTTPTGEVLWSQRHGEFVP